MKKVIALCLVILLSIMVCGCGNYYSIDPEYHFNRAILSMPDGTIKELDICGWSDSTNSEKFTITATDGTVYLVSANNCVLIGEGK